MPTFGRVLATVGDQAAAWIVGDGSYAIGAVGESNYQEALEQLAGGRKRSGVRVDVTAELILEDENPYDPKAVAVKVDGHKVGYLSRDDARTFREEVGDRLESAGRIHCKARISGGWDRGPGNRGHFGLRLDIASTSS